MADGKHAQTARDRRRPGTLLVLSSTGTAPEPLPLPGAGPLPPPPPALASPPTSRTLRFARVLAQPEVDLSALKELAWSGVPPGLRPQVWRLLACYALPCEARRDAALARKRADYAQLVRRHHSVAPDSRPPDEAAALRQIRLDTPRTAPELPWLRCPAVLAALERVLFVRSVRSSAAGYVQGLADLAVPFLLVFLGESVCAGLPEDDSGAAWRQRLGAAEPWPHAAARAMADAEADTYWCLCRLLDGVTQNYTFAQPGIQRSVHSMSLLVRRLDSRLDSHLTSLGVDSLTFAFRWANCLLQRELPPGLGPRLWDTYLAESCDDPQALSAFLPFLLASFLLHWRELLLELDFQAVLCCLQSPPTAGWGESELAEALGRAHQYRISFAHAGSHHLE